MQGRGQRLKSGQHSLMDNRNSIGFYSQMKGVNYTFFDIIYCGVEAPFLTHLEIDLRPFKPQMECKLYNKLFGTYYYLY